MGANSKIEWTHHTMNPWWGCQRVSPGCENCYAENFSKRVGFKIWGPKTERRFFGDKHWNEPRKWNEAAERAGERRRVFCASMADVFEDRDELVPHRLRLARLIHETPALDWLLLTKRPQNMLRLTPFWPNEWPRNVWAGTTVEDQTRAKERVPELIKVPARVRFLSCEPLLEEVNIAPWLYPGVIGAEPGDDDYDAIDWVIVGGESGRGARPFDIAWARSIVDQCRGAGTAVHVKRLGADAREGLVQLRTKDKKGGNWDHWPTDLQIRQYPEVA